MGSERSRLVGQGRTKALAGSIREEGEDWVNVYLVGG